MPRLINFELLREPINWAIVALMLAMAAFALNLLVAPPSHDGTHVFTGGVE